jgi:hypothetical protein
MLQQSPKPGSSQVGTSHSPPKAICAQTSSHSKSQQYGSTLHTARQHTMSLQPGVPSEGEKQL